MYSCAVCGLAVIVLPDTEPIRGCEHDDAAIIAACVADLEGEGGLT